MKVAFCTTCKGRAQHIKETLPRNLADNLSCPDAVFVLLDYNSQDHLKEYVRKNHQKAIDTGRLVVYSHHEAEKFQMAHAKNMAHRLGILEGADVLVNLDADNFTGPDFARYVSDQFSASSSNGHMFLWARMVKEGPERTPRGINGRIAVPQRAFLNVGGYDEQFSTWSPDDKDFHLRLRRLGYAPYEIDRRFLKAILHNDRMRFREYQHVSSRPGEDSDETIGDSDTTVVNFGRIGCGAVYRNFGNEAIILDSLPTRIFGIGLHKTATTSLHHALRILGFDSAHWENAHWAKAIWEEMTTWGRSHTLERHYALCDLPIPLLYQQLDRAYPGSKFILTVRNETSWLQSVQNHWSHDHNRFRASWSTDPFTHKVHKLLYGQKGFDAEIFLARYRRHNAEVQEYFKDRPADLLVMDMDSNPGWNALCAFLERPIPAEPYPMKLVTRKT